MFYYLYKITNLINNKIYIGIHKTNNLDDGYMGSGKLILRAIKKYGKESFKKEIIKFFETYQDALIEEYNVVTDEFISRKDTYNMKRGGIGGFDHINKLPIEERPNIKAFRKLYEEGMITTGGTQHWDKSSYEKCVAQGKLNNELRITSGWNHSDDWKRERSESSKGSKNSQYGVKVCVNLKTGETKRFKSIPEGWIASTELKEQQMSSSRRWFNDGKKNFYIYSTDIRISELNLIKGRL